MNMSHLIEHYPTAIKVITFSLITVNLLCRGEAEELFPPAVLQCAAQLSNQVQAILQWLLRPLILLTGVLPMFLCSVGQLLAAWLLWTGDIGAAAMLAVSPLLAFLLHLLVMAASCLLMGLAE